MKSSTTRNLSVSCLAAAIAACSGGSSAPTSSASSSNPPGPATLSVSLMDAPVDDVASINLMITGLSIKPSDGPAVDLPLADMPFEADLLTLTDSDPAVLVQNAVIEPGTYEWIRMYVDAEIDQSVV